MLYALVCFLLIIFLSGPIMMGLAYLWAVAVRYWPVTGGAVVLFLALIP